MVNGVEPKSRQNVALGQGVIGYATRLDDTFTFCMYRGQRTVGNTLVLAGHHHEFDICLRGKDNPANVGKSDFTEPKLDSCLHEKASEYKYELVL